MVIEEPSCCAAFSTISGRPSLNPFLSSLFFLGIAVSIARVKEPPYLFLLTWLLVMTIPAALAGSGLSAKRAIGALPALVLLIAVGAVVPRQLVRRWSTGRPVTWLRTAWVLVVAGGFIYSGVLAFRDYFVRWASDPDLFAHFELGISAMGDYAGDPPSDERVYVSPELPMHPSIRFHSGLREDIRGYSGRQCLVLPEQTAVGTTYIILHETFILHSRSLHTAPLYCAYR